MSPLRSTRTLLCLLALLCSVSGGAGWAQEAPVAPGEHVRVWPQTDARGRPVGIPIQGRLTTWTADSLVLDDNNRPWTLPLGSVSRLDVSRGRASRGRGAMRGILYGVGPGILLGALLGYGSYQEPSCPSGSLCIDFGPEVAAFGGAVLGAGAGALFGGILGALSPGERWERIPLPARISNAGSREQIAFSASVTF